MNKTSLFRGALGLAMLAATSGFVAAAEVPIDGKAAADKHARHQRHDPVQHTQRTLDRLQAKLSLKEEQQPAWRTYSDAALARAKERADRMQEFRARRDAPRQDLDTASRLDKSAEAMRARADQLQKIAQDTRSFQQALSPEQQAIFDLYWKSERQGRRMGGHRPA